MKKLLSSGGFEPHKWRSNCKKILSGLQLDERASESLNVASKANNVNNAKTLGLNWQPEQDIFEFSIQITRNLRETKREVLSTISKLFDPLGLISPILIRAKIIMQETWSANLAWDDPLTIDLQQAWNNYADDLKDIISIQIPRRVISADNVDRFFLHAFCDASMRAYGACVYLQTIYNDNNVSCALLCSKSRVAPTKTKTTILPRLELCGAIVLTRLVKNVVRALNIKFDQLYAWSDSMIALAWICGDPSRQKTFVANRTAEIQSALPQLHWRHVKSGDNPADLISRGTSLKKLQNYKLWWEGPDWLSIICRTNHKI